MRHFVTCGRVSMIAAGLVLALGRTAQAQPELELSNDGYEEGGLAQFQAGFAAGEIAAVRFVPAAPARLLRIRFLFGGGTSSDPVTITLHLWDDGDETVDPGSEVYFDDFAVTPSADAFQDIDLTDVGTITVSGPFRVGLEVHHGGAPGVARDDDGLGFPERSFIYSTGVWGQSSTYGLTGDWIIRAVVTGPTAADGDADGDGDAIADTPVEAEAETGTDGDADADSGPACMSHPECPVGQYCSPAGVCTFDCRTDGDCPVSAGTCNSLGQCVAGASDGGGCGCRHAGRTDLSGLSLLGLVAVVAFLRRRGPL